MCQNPRVCPCVEVEHYSYDPLRITSNLFPCLFSKFCWYLILRALFQFVFGFDQPKFINGPSNFIRFRSSFVCWIVCPVLSVLMYCRYLRKAETGDISSALAWFSVSLLMPLQCLPQSCTSCMHICACALYFKIFCCLFGFTDISGGVYIFLS